MSRVLPALTACLCLAIGLPAVASAQSSGRDHPANIAQKSKKKTPTRGKRGLRGPKGATGAPGAKGDTGAGGAKGDKGEVGLGGTNGTNGTNGANGTNGTNGATVVAVYSSSTAILPGASAYVRALCPVGRRATGGGGSWTDGNQFLSRSIPSTSASYFLADGEIPTAWTVFGFNNGSSTATLVAYVVCAAP